MDDQFADGECSHKEVIGKEGFYCLTKIQYEITNFQNRLSGFSKNIILRRERFQQFEEAQEKANEKV